MASSPTRSIAPRSTGSAARRSDTAASSARGPLGLAGNRPGDAGVGRVLGLELDLRPDLVHRLGDRDRRLGEPGGDQLELAVEGRDVAARPDALQRRGHQLVDDDRALDDLEAPVLERAQRGLEAELEEDRVDLQLHLAFLVVGVKQHHALDAAVPQYLLDLKRNMQGDIAAVGGLEHLAHGQLVGAEALPAMNEAHLAGGVKQVDHPVTGGVAAADDQYPLDTASEVSLVHRRE